MTCSRIPGPGTSAAKSSAPGWRARGWVLHPPPTPTAQAAWGSRSPSPPGARGGLRFDFAGPLARQDTPAQVALPAVRSGDPAAAPAREPEDARRPLPAPAPPGARWGLRFDFAEPLADEPRPHDVPAIARNGLEARAASRASGLTRPGPSSSLPEPRTPATTVPYREEMEQRFGTSFAGVATHLGEQAVLTPFGARAAAWSETVAFASQAPERDVVAHELTHIEQLRHAGGPVPSRAVGTDHPAEREAAQIAAAVHAGATSVQATAAPGGAIAFDRGPAATQDVPLASLMEELAGHVAALESVLLTEEGRAETARVVEDLIAQIDASHAVLSAEQETLVDRARKLVTSAQLVAREPRTSSTTAPGSQVHRESGEALLDRSAGGGQREPAMQRWPDGPRGTGPAPASSDEALDVLNLSEAEYEALTGHRAADLPEGELPGVLPPALSGVPATVGVGSLFTPQTNWYYRVLAPTDPTAAEILGGASLLPRALDPGFTFEPAPTAEMTFRHLRAGGNVPRVGTDRISTARNLEAFETLLANRGTGEMMRVDVEAARRLGAKFLEQGDIMAHLEGIGREVELQLAQARTAGRGKNFIARLEGRVQALKRAKAYAETFGEGQGVQSIPSGAMSRVRGGTLPEALASERAFLRRVRVFRYGGRVLLVVGIATSVARVASAPEGQRVRVAAEEGGGWAFSLAGAAAGAKGGAALGAAFGWETGPGAVVAVILGTLIGGAIGFFAGEAAVSSAFDVVDTKINEAVLSDYQHFKELNPDATPADYDRIQQAMDDFDTWGIP